MQQPSPYIITICNTLEGQLGFKIKNIADAEKASQSLAIEKLHISPHTIARIYGIVKPFRTPYKDTLNVLARYLKYNDWDDYCANQTNVPFDPNYFLTENSDGFSLSIFRLALANEDFNSLKVILAKLYNHQNQAMLFTAAELLGTYVRKSKKQSELLQILGDTSIGHLFFYECYVDENNANNYFSYALINYYLPKVTSDYKRLFVNSFLISQKAHKEELPSEYIISFENIIKKVRMKSCHFHELSRWFECLIIIDGFNGTLEKTWVSHLRKLLKACVLFSDYEKAWLIARALKALMLFGMKEKVLNHLEFNLVIDQLIKNQKKDLHFMALYIIQLYWIMKSKHFEETIIYSPFRIHADLFQNESNEKAAIEFGLASLFASGENKKIIDSNLKKYCEETGTTWVLKLISD
ncbi:hypothetical protein MCEGE10_02400 [Flavobacteriaceae bacterium]